MHNEQKELWIDLLCVPSALKVILLSRRYKLETCWYLNHTAGVRPFIGMLAAIIKAPVQQVTDIVEGEEKIEGMSMYEFARAQTTRCIDTWVATDSLREHIKTFCGRQGFNPHKYEAHLKDAVFYPVLRSLTVAMYAQKFSAKDRAILVLRKTHLHRLLSDFIDNPVSFYATSLLFSNIAARPHHLLDQTVIKESYTNRGLQVVRFLGAWLLDVGCGLLFGSPRREGRTGQAEAANIALELTQHRVREDEINDIAWLNDSNIDRQTVYGITTKDFDRESCDILDQCGIAVYKSGRNIMKLLKYARVYGRRKRPHQIVTASPAYGFRTIMPVIRSLVYIFSGNEPSWLSFQEIKYYCRTMYWQIIYRSLGIKMQYTMIDVDEDKLPKAQALELLGGLSTGGHWSIYLVYYISLQRCYDVLFTWGEQFITYNFDRFAFMARFVTGYPSDHYFRNYKERSRRLRQEYPGKFILSYMDSGMANDVAFSEQMQIDMHQMLCDLLKQHERLVVFLKPKRKHVFEAIAKKVQGLGEYVEAGRIRVFVGDTASAKAVPAYVGMASDLVVGLGISTAAAECYFAGCVSYHADLIGFVNMEFRKRGEGEIVFGDIASLKKAIEDRITGKNILNHEDYKNYYDMLDPYRDGQAARRIGLVMQQLQQALTEGLSREEAVAKTKRECQEFLQRRPALEEALK